MTLTRSRVALLAALLVTALLAGAQAALSSPILPPITAEELLASSLEQAADAPPMSGELAATLGLGLPMTLDDEHVLSDLVGETRLRVERSEDGLRAALLGQRSERLVLTDGHTLTTWDSRTLEATQRVIDASSQRGASHALPEGIDPLAISTRVLALAGTHADIAVDGTARVAGRAAYRLAVTPTDVGTTLGRVEVDIDADTRVPLRTALFARGAQAATIEVAWTRLSFDPIDPGIFSFTPPPGATITELAPEGPGSHAKYRPGPLALLEAITSATGGVGPLVADGFASVAVVPLPAREPAERTERGGTGGMDALLPLDGPLLSLRIAEVGGQRFALAGLVPLARLDEVAATLPTAAP